MSFINHYLAEVRMTLAELPPDQIEKIKDILFKACKDGKQIFIMGNGGSAATASHFACDLARGTIVKAVALTDNVFLLTALANDISYEDIFAWQLMNFLEKDDVVIAFSVSGNSRNVVKAIEDANIKPAVTIGLTGFEGGKLKDVVQECLMVPCTSVERVEDVHLILAHLLSSYLREALR